MTHCTEFIALWQTYQQAHTEQTLDELVEGFIECFIEQEEIANEQMWDTVGDFSLHTWLRLTAR